MQLAKRTESAALLRQFCGSHDVAWANQNACELLGSAKPNANEEVELFSCASQSGCRAVSGSRIASAEASLAHRQARNMCFSFRFLSRAVPATWAYRKVAEQHGGKEKTRKPILGDFIGKQTPHGQKRNVTPPRLFTSAFTWFQEEIHPARVVWGKLKDVKQKTLSKQLCFRFSSPLQGNASMLVPEVLVDEFPLSLAALIC